MTTTITTLSLCLGVTVLASGPFHPIKIKSPDRGAVLRYQKECVGKTTPACVTLRYEAEAVIFDDLDIAERAKVPIERSTMRLLAANALSPQLRVFALDRLLRYGDLTKEDEAVLIAATKSRVPAERELALYSVGRLSDEKWSRMLARRDDAGRMREHERVLRFEEDQLPDFGAQAYPGAETVWFATGPEQVLFVTSDPIAKVVAFYAKAPKKAVSKADLEKQEAAAKAVDPNEMMRLAQTDPQKMQEMMQRLSDPKAAQAGSKADIQRFTKIEREQGVKDAKYVVLEEQPFMMGKVPTKVVAIFTDEFLGKTGILFTLPKQQHMGVGDPMSPDYVTDMELWQIVGRQAKGPPPDSEDDEDMPE